MKNMNENGKVDVFVFGILIIEIYKPSISHYKMRKCMKFYGILIIGIHDYGLGFP